MNNMGTVKQLLVRAQQAGPCCKLWNTANLGSPSGLLDAKPTGISADARDVDEMVFLFI